MQKPKVPKQELGVKIGVPKPELGNEKKAHLVPSP
jgi:hypothetical protein